MKSTVWRLTSDREEGPMEQSLFRLKSTIWMVVKRLVGMEKK